MVLHLFFLTLGSLGSVYPRLGMLILDFKAPEMVDCHRLAPPFGLRRAEQCKIGYLKRSEWVTSVLAPKSKRVSSGARIL